MSSPHPFAANLLAFLLGVVAPLGAIGWLIAYH